MRTREGIELGPSWVDGSLVSIGVTLAFAAAVGRDIRLMLLAAILVLLACIVSLRRRARNEKRRAELRNNEYE